MPDSFSSILGDISKLAPAIGLGTSLFGAINQFSLAGKEKSAMDQSIYYSKNPQAINALVKQFQQPLSSGLTSGVGNVVNASLAEQGLSQAPGIQSQVLSQALAPYQQNSQQMAIEEAFKALGLPIQALQAIQSTMKPDQLALMLKSILPGQQQSPYPTFGGGSVGGQSDPALATNDWIPQNMGPPMNPDDPTPPSLFGTGG